MIKLDKKSLLALISGVLLVMVFIGCKPVADPKDDDETTEEEIAEESTEEVLPAADEGQPETGEPVELVPDKGYMDPEINPEITDTLNDDDLPITPDTPPDYNFVPDPE